MSLYKAPHILTLGVDNEVQPDSMFRMKLVGPGVQLVLHVRCRDGIGNCFLCRIFSRWQISGYCRKLRDDVDVQVRSPYKHALKRLTDRRDLQLFLSQ